MELRRVQNRVELGSLKETLIPLFEKYSQRVPEHEIDTNTMFDNYFFHIILPDCFFFTLSDEKGITGFIGGDILRGPYYNILYIFDVYIPNGIKYLEDMFRSVLRILGGNELWGENDDKVFRVYRRYLKNGSIKKVQFVRVRL